MNVVLALFSALLAAAAVVLLGWQATASEADMARMMGLARQPKPFSLDAWARQIDTGLTAPQILLSLLAWIAAGFLMGLIQGGLFPAVMYALAGGLFYWGTLQDRRAARRSERAQYIARAMDVFRTLLAQGRPMMEALEMAAKSVPPVGQEVLMDLVRRLRTAPTTATGEAIRAWSRDWENPAVDMLAAVFLMAYERRTPIGNFVDTLQAALKDVVNIIHTARAEAKGSEWLTKFLTFWPAIVLTAMALLAPGWRLSMLLNPWVLLPALLGSALTYLLAYRDIRRNLSIDASLGLSREGQGEIPIDRMGSPL